MAMMKYHISDSENYRRVENPGESLMAMIKAGVKYEGRKVRKWKIEDDYSALMPILHLYLEPLSIEYPGCAMPKEGVPPPAQPSSKSRQADELREAARLLSLAGECFKNIASSIDKS